MSYQTLGDIVSLSLSTPLASGEFGLGLQCFNPSVLLCFADKRGQDCLY